MDTAKMRRFGLWGLLLATLYLVFEVSNEAQEETGAVSEPLRETRRQDVAVASEAASDSALAQRKWAEESSGDPFRVVQWYTPPKAKAPPPPAPVAPPLPFVYFGKMAEGEEPYAFLQKGKVVQVVKAGDELDKKYRVESITSNAVTFVYLPLNTVQVATLGTRGAARQRVEANAVTEADGDAETPAVGKKQAPATSVPPNLGDSAEAGDAGAGQSQEQ